ncbi:radical SAM protein [Vibrio bivalvicida]|uniref:Radical SAM core domain-containing protein n=1 Tax=Vibrio bivalvicida TaxID=1276888 RepID=A0A177Y5S2_9VIBR|nr:radical SAM protein [Vibrio bivalvicida]OAJ96194.1 hypothetical protein APB76_00050 [Vibrio bivalvicida]
MNIKEHDFFFFDKAMPIHTWYSPFEGEDVSEDYNYDMRKAFNSVSVDNIKHRGLYFHIPFCEDNICSFCTLNRKINCSDSEIDRYVNALIKEIKVKSKIESVGKIQVESIFFGGGTPSVLSVDQIKKIGLCIRDSFNLSNLKEWSFENNAKSVTEEKLQALKEIGVTHVRIGGQSLNPKYRDLFDLTATKEQLFTAIRKMNKHFDNVSVDMIYGMNGQTLDELAKDIFAVTSLGVKLIDFYPLTSVTSNRKLLNNYKALGLKPKSEQELVLLNVFVRSVMELQGYIPHNGHGYVRKDVGIELNGNPTTSDYTFYYHKAVMGTENGDIIGFGASACSFTNNYLIENEGSISAYVRGIENDQYTATISTLEPSVIKSKAVCAHLPYFGYLEKDLMDLDSVSDETKAAFENCLKHGLIIEQDDIYLLSKKAWYWHSHLMFYLSPESDKKALLSMVESKYSNKRVSDLMGKLEVVDVFEAV